MTNRREQRREAEAAGYVFEESSLGQYWHVGSLSIQRSTGRWENRITGERGWLMSMTILQLIKKEEEKIGAVGH